MRPPDFWRGDAEGRDRAPVLQALLAPVSALYAATVSSRLRNANPYRAPIPVICVGNLTLGGAGKTPIVRALRAMLGSSAHVLLRGYGGAARGPLRVTSSHAASEVGDEALLHAQDGPTWIARDRAAGARAAAEAGARILLLDDGFQNPSLAKNLSLVVIDAGAGFGNGRVFPAGPLREPLRDGLARADALIVIGGAAPDINFARPILHAALSPTAAAPQGPLVAFAGIGRPEKFFDTLRASGAEIAEAAPYPDHHPYSESDLTWLAKLADERGARLITTEKDHVRLPPAWRARVLSLPVIASFDDEAALRALLAPYLASA